MNATFEYAYVFTATEVCERATERFDRFVKHGGEPEGLDYWDFVGEALEMRARALADEARALNFDLDAPR
ncbi:hypothetical protein CFIICLFH_4836 [Methylobacterium goesingense]|nr:hypothetical protein CFIICLFH_4836 [Methylobacterium goesingense]